MSSLVKWCWGLRHTMKYNTVQIVAIKSPTLSIVFRACQLAIALYIIVSVIVLKKGYQRFEAVTGTTVVKTKGSTYNAGGIPWLQQPPVADDYSQIYDSTDLIYPSTERDATFITTNFYITGNQTRSLCYPGSDDWWTIQTPVEGADAACSAKCKRGTLVNEADTVTGGVWTGQYTLKPVNGNPNLLNCYCELSTWCPDENIPKTSSPNDLNLKGIDQWTVSFRQNVQFKAFGVVTTNLWPKNNPVLPIWTVQQMLEGAGLTYNQVRAKGAVLVLASEWNCNLDFSVDDCNPTTSFVNLGQSYNFRRAEYVSLNGFEGTRQLIKHFGVRIMILISGTGGKFDAAAFFTNIGAGIGLLAVATLVADFVAVNVLGHRALYEKAKFKQVEIEEDGRARGISASSRWEAGNPHARAEVEDSSLGLPVSFVHLPARPSAPAQPQPQSPQVADASGEVIVSEDREESWARRQP